MRLGAGGGKLEEKLRATQVTLPVGASGSHAPFTIPYAVYTTTTSVSQLVCCTVAPQPFCPRSFMLLCCLRHPTPLTPRDNVCQ